MGQTIVNLGEGKLESNCIFNNRLVVEVCESFHVHYRNLRIVLSQKDWENFGKGMSDAWDRWNKRGKPDCGQGHMELCRKEVALNPLDNEACKINLNKNLYTLHDGKIFAEGADLIDDTYIHLKIRDLRIELTKSEFKELARVIKEADDAI